MRYSSLVHVSIAAGVVSTLAYGLVDGEPSLYAVSAVVGFTYMTGSLVQLDLAAQVCPRRWAGTLFATLMAGPIGLGAWLAARRNWRLDG